MIPDELAEATLPFVKTSWLAPRRGARPAEKLPNAPPSRPDRVSRIKQRVRSLPTIVQAVVWKRRQRAL